MKKNILIFILLTIICGSYMCIRNNRYVKNNNIDSCLDRGGCWDYIRKKCEMNNQGFCVKNSKDCKNLWNGFWNEKEQYCVINAN